MWPAPPGGTLAPPAVPGCVQPPDNAGLPPTHPVRSCMIWMTIHRPHAGPLKLVQSLRWHCLARLLHLAIDVEAHPNCGCSALPRAFYSLSSLRCFCWSCQLECRRCRRFRRRRRSWTRPDLADFQGRWQYIPSHQTAAASSLPRLHFTSPSPLRLFHLVISLRAQNSIFIPSRT